MFASTLRVPLDAPALVVAVVIGVRGGRLILDVDSDRRLPHHRNR